jgi:HD superfamily phosphohydrolase
MSLDKLRKKIGSSIYKYLVNYGTFVDRARRDKKLFRDPIFGFQRLEPYEVLVVDSPLFQRLRAISQTGFAYLTYPASIHTRFEHSINCLNFAERILNSIRDEGTTISEIDRAQTRLAALLHDVGHCIFSHVSEFFYSEFPEIQEALNDQEISLGNRTESEVVNYCILTSDEFDSMLWKPIVKTCRSDCDFIGQIKPKCIAQMIIGMPPEDDPERRFLTEIINGPLDVDKLDYLSRDAYFTGISLNVDIDRLLPSFRTAFVDNEERNRKERRLVVDHRGIAVVEQLLFARMVLYDTVYNHHKVRAANSLFQAFLKKYCDKDVWPTKSKKLNSISSLLEIDESEFFGHNYSDQEVREYVRCFRSRILPERALVITPRTLVDRDSHTKWSNRCSDFVSREDPVARCNSQKFFSDLRSKIMHYAEEAGASGIQSEDIMIDIPEPPKYGRLGSDTLIQIVEEYVEPLKNLFPFQKVVNNYSTQYKYRSYVFSNQKCRDFVAYAAFRAFKDEGIILNDLSLILAHQERGKTHDLIIKNHLRLPDWRTEFYAPDIQDM